VTKAIFFFDVLLLLLLLCPFHLDTQ